MILMSPGVSVIAAGIVSGLCFVIINGLRKGKSGQSEQESKSKRYIDNTRCACCLKPFVVGRGVECGECEARACRKGCSRWDSPDNSWYCLFCHQRRLWLRRNEKWIETFGGLSANHDAATHRFSTAKSQVFLGGADYAGIAPGVGLAAGGEEDAGDSMERVREFVEKIVDSLVGNVDEIAVDRVYDHRAYDEVVENYREPLAGALARLAVSLQLSISNKPAADTPTMAHAALRDLVERAVEEARRLPGLGNSDAGRSAEPNDISEQTYEDLLATAILNKVIEKYQNENVDGNGNAIDDKPETTPRTKYITSEIEVGLDEGVEEGSSSLEPLSQDEYSSDCSAPVSKYSLNRQEPLSLTIEEHIEEVTTTYTSDEEEEDNEESNGLDFRNAHRVPFPEFGMDIIDPSQESSEETQDEAIAPNHVDLVTNVESWEENWLFQKKKIQAQSEPVSMLVPNPSEDFKPLIGDREADDTSDLSDCAAQSDEEIEEEILEAINNVVLKTPETTEVNGTNGIVTARSQIGGVSVTIGEFNSVKNSVSGSKREEFNDDKFIGAEEKGKNEEKEEGEALRSPHIKLGFEDMLVFHLKDNRSSSVASETRRHNNNSSSEFVGKERLLLGPTSGADKIDDVNLRSTESNSKAETRDCREKKDLSLKSDTTYSVVENTETRTANIVERKVEDVVNVVRSSGIDESTERFEKIVETTSSTKDRELLERKINVTVESKVKSIEIGSAESSLLTKENNVHVENRVKPQLLGRDAGLEVNEFVVNSRDGFKLGQDPEESRLSVDETDGSEVDKNLRKLSSDSEIVVESFDGMKKQCADVEISKDEENQFINHNDDLDLAELPRTPTSSPRMTEATEQETGNNVDFGSLDEKLVSIENRDGFAINSLNETVNSFVRSTERVRSSLDIVTDRFTELEQGVVEAKLIFLDNENERSNISKTEIQEIDLHNEDGAQQESEYTEHYATATQRHLDSLTRHSKSTKINEIYEEFDDHDDIPPPIPSTPPPINRLKQCRKAAALATAEVDVSEPQITERKRVEVDVFLATPPRPGTIAEREHKKWENAAPLENNPYSEENIQKRLWQRQYSRKLSSDTSITGDNNSETPKMTTGTPMQVVLGAGQPDFKRYGRDYYINDAKKANGERTRRSAMLNTVRRNSSLSQTSGSYDEDIEPQVSYGLEKFEEASLRGSLNRRSFRGQNSSPHFVINPLLHLKVDKDFKVAQIDELNDLRRSDSVANNVNDNVSSDREDTASFMNDDNEAAIKNNDLKIIFDEEVYRSKNRSSENLASISDLIIEGNDGKLKVLNEKGKFIELEAENFRKLFKTGDTTDNFAVNPLYNAEEKFPSLVDPSRGSSFVDRDSGMYSIDSNDVAAGRIVEYRDEEMPRRLSVDKTKKHNDIHISTSNGKRYSDFGSFKFNTFGGIKRRRFNWNEFDGECDETDSENEGMADYPEDISNFGSMKCQTFGGIKQTGQFDGKNIAKYRKVKVRPALAFGEAKFAPNKDEIGSEKDMNFLRENFETRRDPNYKKFHDKKPNSNEERTRKKKSSRKIRDEINFGDENLMANFLRDALMRPKSRLSTDNESIYSLDPATRKSQSLRGDFRRQNGINLIRDDDDSLRLEPPGSPEVVQKSFETLSALRKSRSLISNRNGTRSGVGNICRKISDDISMW